MQGTADSITTIASENSLAGTVGTIRLLLRLLLRPPEVGTRPPPRPPPRPRALKPTPGLLPPPVSLLRPVLGRARTDLPHDQCRNDELSCSAIWLIPFLGHPSDFDTVLSCLDGLGRYSVSKFSSVKTVWSRGCDFSSSVVNADAIISHSDRVVFSLA